MPVNNTRPDCLRNWVALNNALSDMGESEVKAVLKYEKANDNRATFVTRLNQRLVGIASVELHKKYPK